MAPQELHDFPPAEIALPHLGQSAAWVSVMSWTESILTDQCKC